MNRLSALATAVALCVAGAAASAQTAAPAAKPKVTKPAAKPAAKATAKPATSTAKPAAETTEALSRNQLDIAQRVLVGRADCEFDQHVEVEPLSGKPGHFRVAYKNVNYTMVPEETTTGAVRLQDKRAGMMWLQIPSKSMLMNSRAGQRMVDGCMLSEQRTAAKS